MEPDGSLPTKFSTVIQIDVLGLKKDEEEEEANNTSLESRLDASRKKSAAKLERAATDLIPQVGGEGALDSINWLVLGPYG